jgi:tetratricopeptide (TPR) repeat protein
VVTHRKFSFAILSASLAVAFAAAIPSELTSARNRQDLNALQSAISRMQSQQSGSKGLDAKYQLSVAYSYAAEVATEQRDKERAEQMASAGVEVAKELTTAAPSNAEYHRMLGQLCGQVIPANPLMGALKFGRCARDEINQAIQLDGKLAMAYVSRGVGNYYLPPSFGGGPELALKDFDQAISLNPNLGDAYLWKGVALRKLNRNGEARQMLQKTLQLSPDRRWAQEQLQKTPAR